MKVRKLCVALAVVVLLQPFPSVAQPALKIGVIQSLTGAAREDGETAVRALKLAQDKLEREQQAKIELLVEDDETLPKNTVSAFQKLADQGVAVIIGPTWLHSLASVVPLAGRRQLVLFNTSNFPEAINFEEGRGYVFTNAYALADDISTFQRYAEKMQVRRIALVRNSTNWALLQVRRYRELADRQQIKVVSEHDTVDVENNDWRPVLPKIKAAEPDAIVFFLGKDDAETFVRRAKEIGISSRMFGGSHTYDAFKRTKDPGLYEDVCITYPLARLRSRPDFVEAYSTRYGEPPQLYADSSYDALLILVPALQKAAETKEPLRDILLKQEFHGLFGHYRYDSQKSFASGGTSLNCVRKGSLHIEQ